MRSILDGTDWVVARMAIGDRSTVVSPLESALAIALVVSYSVDSWSMQPCKIPSS